MSEYSSGKKQKPLNLALIGYGKMGRAVEEVAIAAGHRIVLKISSQNTAELSVENLRYCDVAVEFTGPGSAVKNIVACIDAGTAVISGSTGWQKQWQEVSQYCLASDGTLLHAANFSIGVNIFFELNKKLSQLMSRRTEYDVMLEEIHHTQKKDAPSGTAITLAEEIIQNIPGKNAWEPGEDGRTGVLNISSLRQDPAPGTHKVKYSSAIDEIDIIHTAKSRKGFATGALMAAEFVYGKKGIFAMKDVLEIG